MNIVLEGFDGSGKSTLAQALVKRFGLGYFWASGPPPRHDLSEIIRLCIEQASLTNCVVDRITAISARAYMSVDYTHEKWWLFTEMVKCMNRNGFLFIHCVADGAFTNDKDHDTPEYQAFLIEHRSSILQKYDNIFSTIPHFRYNFKQQTLREVFEWIQTQKEMQCSS